jgi:hypothetical protein
VTPLPYRRFVHLGFNPVGSSPPSFFSDNQRMREAIESYLHQNAGDWYRYAAQNYVVWTHEGLSEFASNLRQQPGLQNIYLFVTEFSPVGANGWMPQAFWDWLFKPRV